MTQAAVFYAVVGILLILVESPLHVATLLFGSVTYIAYHLRFPETPGWLQLSLTLGTTAVFSMFLHTWIDARKEIARRKSDPSSDQNT